MKKLLVRAGIFLLALVALLYLGRNFIARKGVELGVRTATGFPLTIGRVEWGLLRGTLAVSDLRLQNPPEFPDRSFMDLPVVTVDYDTFSLLRGAPHLREVIVRVKEVTLVKNAQGESNATVLQRKLARPDPGAAEKSAYRVDVLKLHIGTVIIKDYSKGPAGSGRTWRLNQDLIIRDLSATTSITAVVMRHLLGPVGTVAGDLVQNASDLGQKAGQGIRDTLKKVVPPQ